MKLAGGQFVGLGNPCDPRYSGQDFKNFLGNGMAVPYRANDRLLDTLNKVWSKILAFDNRNYVINLCLAGSWVHDN